MPHFFRPLAILVPGLCLCITGAADGAQQIYRDAVLADNPAGYWQLDETAGTVAADAGGATQQPGSYQDCVLGQASAFPALGTAVSFNGSTSRVRIEPDSVFELGTGDFSVELWYDITTGARGDMFTYKNATDFGIFANNSGSGSLGGYHNGFLPVTTTTINAWHHVVMTRSAGTLLMYLDGVLVGNTADAVSFSAGAPIFIGTNHTGAPGYAMTIPFTGLIDEVAVYGSALSAARVLAHFQSANPAIPPVIVNVPASNVQTSSATIGAQLTIVGSPAPSVTLFWGDNDAGTAGPWDNQIDLGIVSNTTAATRNLSGLASGAAYYFRARASNPSGAVWAGATATFTTGSATPPAVENLPPIGVSGIAATLRGQVTSTGNDPPVVKIYFGPSDGGIIPANWQQSFTLPVQSGAFLQLASPLAPLTAYHYRSFAQNAAGSAWAPSTQTFTTPAYTPPPVIINEIHYNEDDPTVHSEFIELHNPGAQAIDIAGWIFDQGINFKLPAGASIPGGGYAIVCEDPATIQAKWSVGGAGVYSWQDGPVSKFNSLSNSGETIRLRDAVGNIIDEVDYQSGFPWPTVGDPPNYSIELLHPALDNGAGGNWRRSDGGSTGTQEVTYVPAASLNWKYRKALSEPSTPPEAWRGIGFAEDAAWLAAPSGTPIGYGDPATTLLNDMRNAASPPGYTSIHMRQTFQVSGPVSGQLRLRVWCDDGYVAWINGQEVDRRGPAEGAFVPFNGIAGRGHEAYNQAPEEKFIAAPNSIIQQGTNVLCVHALNESLNGSSDFWIDAELKVVAGSSGGGPTPRAINSVFSANAPPVIRQVEHAPVAPVAGQTWMKSGQAVRISARITDPDNVSAAALLYQIVEPGDYIKDDDARYNAAGSWTTLAMNDGGANGDLAAGDGIFSAIIPASVQTHRRLIRYRITATDGAALTVRVPYADDPQPNFAYFVHESVPDWTGSTRPGVNPNVTYTGAMLSRVPQFHLITRVEEHAGAQSVPIPKADGTSQAAGGQYTHSLYNWKGALCYDGRVYDHIRYRARGGVWRFSMGKNMWKFDFNKGHDFEARDNYGQKFGQPWKKLNFSSCIQQGDFLYRGEQGLFEGVGFRLFQLAGCPAEHTSLAHFRIIERPSETNNTASQFDDDFQGLYLGIEQQDGQFLDEHGLPDGNLYKMEGGTGELNNQGPLAVVPAKSDLTAFQAYTQTEAFWRTNCDLENYYDLRSIIDCIHHYDIGDGKNFFYYRNPVTAKWTQLPWDLDLTWADNMYRADSGIAGLAPSGNSTEPFFSRIWAIPALRLEYQNRSREVLDLLWNTEQTGMLLDEYASFVYQPGQPSFVDADRAMWDYNPILISGAVNSSKAGHGRFYQMAADSPDGGNSSPGTPAGTFAGMIQRLKNYITTRRNVITAQILNNESQIPARPVVTASGASQTAIPVNALSFTSSAYSSPASSAFAAMKWRIAKVTDPAAPGYLPYNNANRRSYEIEASWESAELPAFAAGVTIPPIAAEPGATYRVRVKHKDAAGRWSHWSNPRQFTALPPDISGYLNSLVISKFMYNPAAPSGPELAVTINADDFEWIELRNMGQATLDLTPLRFTKGIDFDFAGSAITSLAPDTRVLVVKNLAAFQVRYGNALPVAGAWGGDNLSNGGESLKLSYGAGVAVREFNYDDDPPWPSGTDGQGAPLVLVNPASIPDHALAQNWRAGLSANGSPGSGDTGAQAGYASWASANGAGAAGADQDNDGVRNVLEHFFGSNPLASSAVPQTAGLMLVDGEQYQTLSFTRRLAADDLSWRAERSVSLDTWLSGAGQTVLVSQTTNPDGSGTFVYRSAVPYSTGQREFLHLFVQLNSP